MHARSCVRVRRVRSHRRPGSVGHGQQRGGCWHQRVGGVRGWGQRTGGGRRHTCAAPPAGKRRLFGRRWQSGVGKRMLSGRGGGGGGPRPSNASGIVSRRGSSPGRTPRMGGGSSARSGTSTGAVSGTRRGGRRAALRSTVTGRGARRPCGRRSWRHGRRTGGAQARALLGLRFGVLPGVQRVKRLRHRCFHFLPHGMCGA